MKKPLTYTAISTILLLWLRYDHILGSGKLNIPEEYSSIAFTVYCMLISFFSLASFLLLRKKKFMTKTTRVLKTFLMGVNMMYVIIAVFLLLLILMLSVSGFPMQD